ncbi:MAG: MGMT family protein [Candidatus Pacebacteria bacterium]|nr:MGMT family protein [Candidatus Paceibacterota bacterium]MCD8527960.1 MGMT family protein [Candidatus Paceibacterota bacterium]MCD8563589.1 MGMT family protein [Candidatus Paceibacterota bacterium]
MPTFTQKVLHVVSKIPAGSVMTYGEVARATGNPKAARAVGTIMKNNYDPAIPCHRVILSSGKAGAYNRGGEDAKKELLQREGVEV